MIFLSILILIVAIALPSINQNIRSILYVRISSIIFIYAGALAFNAFYIQSIGSGIGIYSGLFQVTTISQLLEVIIYINNSFSSLIYNNVSDDSLLFLIINPIKPGKDSKDNKSYTITSIIKKVVLVIIFLLTLFSIIVIYKGFSFNQAMMILDNITSNSTVVYLSYKVLLASVWFLIGLNSYLYVLPKSIINKINRLSILELFLMLFALFMISAVIKSLAYGYFPPLYQDFSTYTWLGEVKSTPCSTPELPTPSNPSSSNTDNVSNGAIMAAAITGAYQIAKRVPTVTGKVATVAAGIGVGAAGIVAKNISDNISANVGKKNFIINSNFIDSVKDSLHLTGNDALDLLTVIQYFQLLQLIIIALICYNIFFTHVNLGKLEAFLSRILPIIMVRWYIKAITIYQKSGFIIFICLIILLAISNYFSYYYLGFFIDNLDGIIAYYFKN